MALVGQASMHSLHLIHSPLFGLFLISTSNLHVFWHIPQSIHLFSKISILYKATGLNREYIAPKGQINLQNGLLINIDAPIVITNKNTFHENKNPTAPRNDEFTRNKGIPASNVPAGQIYLQKAGAPIPYLFTKSIGIKITKTTRIIYFKYLSLFLPLIRYFFDGIL